MIYLIFTLIYLVLHFIYYITIGKHSAKLQTESGVFYYHLASVLVTSVSLMVFLLLFKTDNQIHIIFSIICLHGIYSITFLEFWSLAEGGFSISILRGFAENNLLSDEKQEELIRIGDSKFSKRLHSLEQMKLLNYTGDNLILTTRGKIIAKLFNLVTFLTHMRRIG